MNHMFLPILFIPFFGHEHPEAVAYIEYAPVKVYGSRPLPDYIYLTKDYMPYTHGFLADDGSEDLWDEQNS